MSIRFDHLVGRPFVYGDTDCYGLFRDFYRDNFGILLSDYARVSNWWNEAPELDLFMKNFRAEGFEVITESKQKLRVGDGVLIAYGSRVACHIGVIVAPHRFLHHPPQALSRVDLYAGPWSSRTLAVIRHPEAPAVVEAASVSLADLLPPHKREKYRDAIQRAEAEYAPHRPGPAG